MKLKRQLRKLTIFIKEKPDRAISVGSLLISVIFGFWGIRLTYSNDALGEEMKNIASSQEEITRSQYNMNARIENEKTLEKLNGFLRDYNSLVVVMADLDVDLIFYRLSRKGERVGDEVLKTSDLRVRAAFLDKAQNHLTKYAHMNELFPNTTCLTQWENCITSIIASNTACKAQMKYGMVKDTSAKGVQEYRNMLYTVNDLVDSIRAHIDTCKAITQKNANIINKEIEATLPLSHGVRLNL